MTATTLTSDLETATRTAANHGSRAVAVRRALLIVCPVLAGLFCVLGAIADPAAGISGSKMTEVYIKHSDALQWKSTGYHWA